jgi:hypothetical protein
MDIVLFSICLCFLFMPFKGIVCMFLVVYFLNCYHKSETKFHMVAELVSFYSIKNVFYTVFIIVITISCGKFHMLLYSVNFFMELDVFLSCLLLR